MISDDVGNPRVGLDAAEVRKSVKSVERARARRKSETFCSHISSPTNWNQLKSNLGANKLTTPTGKHKSGSSVLINHQTQAHAHTVAMNSFSSNRTQLMAALALVALSCTLLAAEAKLLRGSPRYDDFDSGYGDGLYGSGSNYVRTGERALMTVRGARNPHSGRTLTNMQLEAEPFRNPRGIYDRLDGYGRGGPVYGRPHYG